MGISLRHANKDIKMLRDYNSKLKERMVALKKDFQFMLKQVSKEQRDKKTQSAVAFKDKRLRFMDKKSRKSAEQMNGLKEENTTLLHFLSSLGTHILLKKLDNLGIQEFEKKAKLLNITKGDLLLVDDPDIVSEKAILEIKGKVEVIFYKKPVSKKIEGRLPFIFLNSKEARLEEDHYFAIVEKVVLERLRSKASVLRKVIEDYRRERSL